VGAKRQMGCKKANGAPKGKWGAIKAYGVPKRQVGRQEKAYRAPKRQMWDAVKANVLP
jgi:hypothetical protein